MRYGSGAVALCFLLIGISALAGQLSPALDASLSRNRPDEPVDVLVFLREQAEIQTLDANLRARGAGRAERHRRVVEALRAAVGGQESLGNYLAGVKRSGAPIEYRFYWLVNACAVRAPGSEIQRLANRPEVEWIEPAPVPVALPGESTRDAVETDSNPPGRGLEGRGESDSRRGNPLPSGLVAIRVPEVWRDFGIDGTGRLLALVDTGADGTTPAFADRWRGASGEHPWEACWLDASGTGSSFPFDPTGHGTQVLGVLTGLDPATGDTTGVAWGAQWIAAAAINGGSGNTLDTRILDCLQWFIDPDGDPETLDDVPDVVQNSWRVNESQGNCTDCDSRWWEAIDNCAAAGVVTIWSAGNEGPGAGTIGSPADRATSLTNAFSVGSVNATGGVWPYPVHHSSSRGPSGCAAPESFRIKPEIVAPGVDIRTTEPGGGYVLATGTSFSGPHVAGVVALLRQADPGLDVEDIKSLLLQTARDAGATGDDNSYGSGFIDAYAAVEAALVGMGRIEGTVRNASWNDEPLAGAAIEAVDTAYRFTADTEGMYGGRIREGGYLVRAALPGFETQTLPVDILASGTATVDFSLIDAAGPWIGEVSEPGTVADTLDPYPISALVTDPSTVSEVALHFRRNGEGWEETPMEPTIDGWYVADLPPAPVGTIYDYYVRAADGPGSVSTSPPDAPSSAYHLLVTQLVHEWDGEPPELPAWEAGAPDDDATAGHWLLVDPVGSDEDGRPLQAEDDHTAEPGVQAWVTGNGSPGGWLGDADVDRGCTSLVSPVLDLTGAAEAYLVHHIWYQQGNLFADDSLRIEISSDGGASWHLLVALSDPASWDRRILPLHEHVSLGAETRLRLRACDLGIQGIVEAGLDDVRLEIVPVSALADLSNGSAPGPSWLDVRPVPSHGEVDIEFSLRSPASTSVCVLDVGGRLVRTIRDARSPAGLSVLRWDGRDALGRRVPAGVYFVQLASGADRTVRRMVILR